MKTKKLFFFNFLFFILIFISGCQKYSNFETENYYIKFPASETFISNTKLDTSIIKIEYEKTPYNVSVITINKTECVNMNICISQELECFLDGKNTKNITTQSTIINGCHAKLVSGVNVYTNKKIFWSFAVLSDKQKYYVIRVSSEDAFLSTNEYYNQKIIYSFHLK